MDMYNSNEVPVDGHAYWIKHKELDIEIFFNVYQTYTWVSASYYFWDEESIVGIGTHDIKEAGVKASLKKATKVAINELLQELDEQGISVWQSKNPWTDQKAMFVFIAPEKKGKK